MILFSGILTSVPVCHNKSKRDLAHLDPQTRALVFSHSYTLVNRFEKKKKMNPWGFQWDPNIQALRNSTLSSIDVGPLGPKRVSIKPSLFWEYELYSL